MRYYNLERSPQGYRLQSRTPAQALTEPLDITDSPAIDPTEKLNEPIPTAR